MTLSWRSLVIDTVRDPQSAGRTVMAIDIARRDIWLSVAAVAALNAVFSGILGLISPPTPADAQAMPVIAMSPLPQALLIGGLLVLLAHVLTWVGRIFGGTGQIDDFMKLMVWMQLVAMVLQAGNLIVLLALPVLGSLLVIAIVVLMVRVLVSFVMVGHGFSSLGTAAMVLIGSFIGMVIGLSVLLILIGAGNLGVQTGV